MLLLLELFKLIYRGHLMRAGIGIALDFNSEQWIFIKQPEGVQNTLKGKVKMQTLPLRSLKSD